MRQMNIVLSHLDIGLQNSYTNWCDAVVRKKKSLKIQMNETFGGENNDNDMQRTRENDNLKNRK